MLRREAMKLAVQRQRQSSYASDMPGVHSRGCTGSSRNTTQTSGTVFHLVSDRETHDVVTGAGAETVFHLEGG